MMAAAEPTPFDFVVADHFRPLTDRDAAIRLFQRSVRMVEIEVFSYCNRVCWFCPNSFIDRRSTCEYMPEALYLRILQQLADASYREMISYSRYNEPLSDRIILRRLEQARHVVPGALLHTNTNGDYLTRSYLDDLASAGLGSLNIQVYLGNRERYDHDRMRSRLRDIVDKLGLDAPITVDEPGTWLEARAVHRGLRMRIYARNFAMNGCSRGDSVPIEVTSRRTSPCLSPFYHLYIDYNGSVMPCCNLRSDVPSHRDMVVARLTEASDLFLVHAGHALAGWRRGLVGYDVKGGVCGGCSFGTIDATPANRHRQESLRALAQVVALSISSNEVAPEARP